MRAQDAKEEAFKFHKFHAPFKDAIIERNLSILRRSKFLADYPIHTIVQRATPLSTLPVCQHQPSISPRSLPVFIISKQGKSFLNR